MHQLKRISTVPGTILQIFVDQPTGDGDAGFGQGGTFYFAPAGEDGDSAMVSTHAATIIMGDVGLAPHFTCDPALDVPAEAPPAVEPPTKRRKADLNASMVEPAKLDGNA